MFLRIKNKIDRELETYLTSVNKLYSLKTLSPELYGNIKEFACRPGKRVRPVLFCIGYLGFSKKTPPGLYRSALSLELLHDFMLVHDDIIDKSDTRRGRPAMHTLLKKSLGGNKKICFDGEDLAIVAGDVMYAMALDAFLAVREEAARKEKTFRKLFLAALYTGSGEFIELMLGAKPIECIAQREIYKVYDYKTANYTFASPLTMGATLAGAKPSQIKKLYSYGMLLGRAFQIQDDIIGVFGKIKETGKSNLTDIKEAKRTILIWYAFNHAGKKDKNLIKKVMENKTDGNPELLKVRAIIEKTGALDYAKKEIKRLYALAQKEISSLKMAPRYKQALEAFSKSILKA